MRKVIASIPEIVVVVDREGVIRYINRVEPGYRRDDVLGTRATAILLSASIEVFEAALSSVLATGEAEEYEVEGHAPDGSPAWYRAQMYPHRDAGEIVGAVIMSTNITALRSAEDTLTRLRELLPVCAWCNRIRNEQGSWESLASYVGKRMDAQVSHCMCPECYRQEQDGIDDARPAE